MARYIDADELLNRLPGNLPYKSSVKRVLIQAPTADVAPKTEVAIEIFDDIEKSLPNDLPLLSTIIVPYLKKFKDRYVIEKLDKQGNIIESIFKDIDEIILLSAPDDSIKVDIIWHKKYEELKEKYGVK